MSFTLTCLVTIGKYVFDSVHNIKIRSTWRELGDQATIQLPGPNGLLEEAIRCGDKVKVQIGYRGFPLRTEFTGYVKEISPKFPFELLCEDEVYQLRRRKVEGSWESISLLDLLKHIVPTAQLSSTIPAVLLAPFRLVDVTAAEALRKLKEEYLLCAYFREGKLFVGMPYTEFTGSDKLPGRYARYSFDQNVKADGLNLVYKRAEDVRVKAKVINLLPNNKRVEVEVGDEGGEVRTIHKRNLTTDKEALKKIGLQELQNYRYDGYRGSFTAWGLPYLVHSATIDLENKRFPQRNGSYLVDQIETSFGVNGFSRVIAVGPKARVNT